MTLACRDGNELGGLTMAPPALLQLAEEDTQDHADEEDDDESVKTEDVDYEPELGVRQTLGCWCARPVTKGIS